MRRVQRRTVDAVLKVGEQCRVLEVDEKQHFNKFRAETFRHYPAWAEVAFDCEEWRRRSADKTKLEGGGFAKAKPPCSRNSTGDTSSALFAMHCATYYHRFMVLLPPSG